MRRILILALAATIIPLSVLQLRGCRRNLDIGSRYSEDSTKVLLGFARKDRVRVIFRAHPRTVLIADRNRVTLGQSYEFYCPLVEQGFRSWAFFRIAKDGVVLGRLEPRGGRLQGEWKGERVSLAFDHVYDLDEEDALVHVEDSQAIFAELVEELDW